MTNQKTIDQPTKLGLAGIVAKRPGPESWRPPINFMKTITIQFDDVPDGTVVDHTYATSGVNFASLTPAVGPAYVRRLQLGTAASGLNVLSMTNSPGWTGAFFDTRQGAVEATFDQLQSSVSVMALPLNSPEGLGHDDNRPFIEAFDSAGTYLGRARTQLGPDDQNFYMVWQPLSYVSATRNIKKIRMSSQAHGSRWVYATFDNLSFQINLLLQRP